MKRLAALLIGLTVFIPALAQDAPPVIAPENAAALTLLDSAGSALPTGVQFSPDGRYILAVTTDRTLVYSAEDPDAEPQIFPFNEFTFDHNGYLAIGNERWNLDTGQSIGIPPSIKVTREGAGDPAVIEVVKPGGGTMRVETEIIEPVRRTVVDDAYTVLAVASDGDILQRISPTVYLYALPSGRQIAALPQITNHPISNMFFTLWSDSSLLVVETMETYYGADGSIAIYRAATGSLLPQFSGSIRQPLARSEDGAFAYLLPDNTVVLGTGYAVTAFTHEDTNSNSRIYIGRGGLAVVGGKIYLAPFDKDGNIGEFLVDNLYAYVSGAPAFSGSLFYYANDTNIYVWDASSPAEGIRTIQTTARYRDTRISPDATLFSHIDEQGIMRIREAESDKLGRTRGRAPSHAVISPDWSRAAYFDGKLLTVKDLTNEQTYTREVIPGHLGDVADFQNGFAAFIGDALQVVDLDPANGRAGTVKIDGPFNGAHFFGEGACIVTFAPSNGGSSDLVIHRLNTEAGCDPEEYKTNLDARGSVVTPDGRFLAGYSTYCASPYAYPSANIHPLRGQPPGELPNILHIMFGCGRHAFAFAPDGATIYFADGMLRRSRFDMDGTLLSEEDLGTLLDYGDPVNYSFARIAGVFLSPDEKTIAVYVEDSKGAEWVQERYIEIFALDDLEPGTLRRDVRPLQTIPDATVAHFSPNSDYIVTDKGLYSVQFANATPAINGTISAFSPDSQLLATYQGGFVTLWRVPQPQPTDLPLAQYEIGGVRELAFSADGTRLYIVRAGEVQTWGVAP